jgi:hypothetical protein
MMKSHYDIALGRVEPIQDAAPLILATKHPHGNADIICMEYSGISSRRLPSGETEMGLTHYFHKGHVVSRYVSDYPETVPTHCFDVSFAALKGASGAPVIVEQSGQVAGMIVANVERHLLPAQVERIESEDGVVEETRYLLPNGKAIGWQHLVAFVEETQG